MERDFKTFYNHTIATFFPFYKTTLNTFVLWKNNFTKSGTLFLSIHDKSAKVLQQALSREGKLFASH